MNWRRFSVLSLVLLGLLGVVGCSPSGDSVKKAIEKKSFCKLTDYSVQGDPRKDNQGYIHYEFTATVNCKGSRSFHSAKFYEPTPITGEAEMIGKWFGIMHELSRYEFNPAERSGSKGNKKADDDDDE